jgi:hypothetical protein
MNFNCIFLSLLFKRVNVKKYDVNSAALSTASRLIFFRRKLQFFL